MKSLKGVKRVWNPLPRALKEKIRNLYIPVLKKPLIKEVQKLPITGSGISKDGVPWASLSNGLKFYGFLPSPNDRALYRYIDKNLKKKLIEDASGVAIDIVTRYIYPHAQPDKTPPYSLFARRTCFHPQHIDTIQDIPGASPKLKRKLLELFAIKEGDVFVDVGSYVGYGALKMGGLVGTSGKVIAIEADLDCRLLLEKNINLNSIGNIQIVPKAVWNEKGMMSLHRSYKQANSLVQDIIKETETNTVQVQTDTIDNILDELNVANVSVISLTINGAELEAIEGMSKTLEAYSPRLSIAGWYLRDGTPIWRKARSLLKEKGYETVKGNKGRVFAWKKTY